MVELVGLKVDILVALRTPVAAKPGGNITGFSVDVGFEISAKRLEFLGEVIPSLTGVGTARPGLPCERQLNNSGFHW